MEEHHKGNGDFKRDFNGRLNSSSKTDSWMKLQRNYRLQVLSCRAEQLQLSLNVHLLSASTGGSAHCASSGEMGMTQRAAKMIKARIGFMRED